MTQSPGVLFERLLDIMRRLRGPCGLSLGSRADAHLAQALPDRGSIRGPRGHRGRSSPTRFARSSATCSSRSCSTPRSAPSAASSRWRPARTARRQDDPPPSARVRRRAGADAGSGARAVGGHQAARGRGAGPATLGDRWRAAGAPGARPGPAHPEQGRAGRTSTGRTRARRGRRSRRKSARRRPRSRPVTAAGSRRSWGRAVFARQRRPPRRPSTPRTRCSGPSRSSGAASSTMEDDLNARGKSIASVSPEELERSWEAVEGAGAGADEGRRSVRPRSRSSAATSPTSKSTRIVNAANTTLAMGTGVAARHQAQGRRPDRGRSHAPGPDRGRRGRAHPRRQPAPPPTSSTRP